MLSQPISAVTEDIFREAKGEACDLHHDERETDMFGPTLADANRIIAAAFEKAADLDLKPLGVAVLDPGGHLVAFQRQDEASIFRFEIAFGKAYGALAVGVGSRDVAKMAVERPHLILGLSGVSGGKVVPVPGGVLIRRNGEISGFQAKEPLGPGTGVRPFRKRVPVPVPKIRPRQWRVGRLRAAGRSGASQTATPTT